MITSDVIHGDPAKKILAEARKMEADLIILGARRSTFWLTYMDQGVTPAICAVAMSPGIIAGTGTEGRHGGDVEEMDSWQQ